MNPIEEISAFEIYAKKRKYNQSVLPTCKFKHSKSTKLIKNQKNDDKPIKPGKLEDRTKTFSVENGKISKRSSKNLNNIKNKMPSNKVKNGNVKSKKKESMELSKSKKHNENVFEVEEKITKKLNKNDQSGRNPSRQNEIPQNIFEVEERKAEKLNESDQPELDPIKQSEKLFEWLIYPFQREEFIKKNWESTPLHIKRFKPKYYASLMSTSMLDKILRDNHILFTKNIDITSFTNDKRENHNPVGRALPNVVWDYFLNGCSIRMLNPQTYVPKLHTLNATLQEYFGCFVGANCYLTPPDSQGFAPHYDDIEAFILQIEGKKRWRLYQPRSENEVLPRYSSPNFSEKDIGEPIFDTVVNAGDLLYFPRGFIHQGDTFGFDQHSFHITLSVYQRNSWGDFLEKLLPIALKDAIENNAYFRKGLPLNYLRYTGSVFSNNTSDSQRQEFLNQTKSLLSTIFSNYINIDKAADEMAKNHIHDFLPPVLNEDESLCSIYKGGAKMIKDGIIINQVEIEPDTFIRLSRAHCARLVDEGDTYKIYYSCENSKEYHEYELQYVEVDLEYGPVVQEIFAKYPEYIRVEDLPHDDLDKKIQLVNDLWEKGIVLPQEPLF